METVRRKNMSTVEIPWTSESIRPRREGRRGWPLILDWVYLFLLLAAFPYTLYKLFATEKYRHGLRERLGWVPPRAGKAPCLWLHGVSVGEVLAARQFVTELLRTLPDWEIVISTTTRTGQQIAHQHFGERHQVFYFPYDFTRAVHSTFQRIRPDAVVLMELEVWPAFLEEARRRALPVFVANGRLSETSFRGYQRIRPLMKRFLEPIRMVLVQNPIYGERFRSLGVRERFIQTTGNMKYDNLPAPILAEAAHSLRKEYGFDPTEPILLAGSTHEPEELALVEIYESLRKTDPGLRLILVPRHPERAADLTKRIEERGHPVLRRSRWQLNSGSNSEKKSPTPSIFLVDTIGELGKLYCLADLVFIGGSLIDHGGQNVLEPAGAGKPVLIGPSYRNFKEEVERLRDAGGLLVTRDSSELETHLTHLLQDPNARHRMGNRGRETLTELRGASAENASRISNILTPTLSSRGSLPKKNKPIH